MNLHNFKVYLQVTSQSLLYSVHVDVDVDVDVDNSKQFFYTFQESTIHGIRYFVDGENAFHRFVWFIIMGFSVGGLSYLVFNSYM